MLHIVCGKGGGEIVDIKHHLENNTEDIVKKNVHITTSVPTHYRENLKLHIFVYLISMYFVCLNNKVHWDIK